MYISDLQPRWCLNCRRVFHADTGSITHPENATAVLKISNEIVTTPFDSGAEVLIVDTTFARPAGCVIEECRNEKYVVFVKKIYMTEGRTKKITINGSLVYFSLLGWAVR